MRFDQISGHKHDIYLYGKLLARAANKILSSCLQKLDGCLYLKYGFRKDCPKKF